MAQRMRMYNPAHPGEILQMLIGPEGLDITVTEAARRLGVSRVALSRVLNGSAALSADLAFRLERANVSTAEHWLAMQNARDIWLVRQKKQTPVVALQPRSKLAA